MSDTLTVLTSEIGKHLSKAFRGGVVPLKGQVPIYLYSTLTL